MTPKPDARLAPSEDEWDAWTQHPVTRFVAAAYDIAANAQMGEWQASLGSTDPTALLKQSITTAVRADCYRAFLETSLEQYLDIVDPSRKDARRAPRTAGDYQRPLSTRGRRAVA